MGLVVFSDTPPPALYADPLVIHHWENRLHLFRNRIARLEWLIATDVMGYHRSAARLLRAFDLGHFGPTNTAMKMPRIRLYGTT